MRIKLNLSAIKNIPYKYQKIVFPMNKQCILVKDLKSSICKFIMSIIGVEISTNEISLYIHNCIVLDQFESNKVIKDNDII